MPDITVCVNRTCTKRMACYRYRAHWSDRWQSVSLFLEPGCPHHSPIREGDRIVSEEEADARTMKKPS